MDATYKMYLVAERGYSPLTVKRYSQQLGLAETFLAARGKTLSTAEPEDYQAWLRSLSERGLESVTVYDCYAVLRGWLKYQATVLGRDVTRFLSYIAGPRVEKNLPHPFNQDEMRSVLAAIHARPKRKYYLRDVAIYEVLYAGGLRNSELRGLRWRDVTINPDGTGSARVFGKGSKERIVMLTSAAIGALQCYLFCNPRKPDEWIFSMTGGRQMARTELWEIVERWGRWAKLPRRLRPHLFRHACATHWLGGMTSQGTGDIGLFYVQAQLGHNQIETTQRYTHVEPKALKRWHTQFAPARMA